MSYYTYRPAAPLATFIKKLWLYRANPTPYQQEQVLPHGSVGLVFNLQQDYIRIYDRQVPTSFKEFGGSVLVGTFSQFFVIDRVCQQNIMGVEFRPGGAFPFFKLPVSEFRDTHLPLDLVWGGETAALREQLQNASTPQAKFHLLEQHLKRQITASRTYHPAVAFALYQFKHQPYSVAHLCSQIGLSQRHFIQLFSEQVGLTPKLYWRIQRFQTTLRLLHQNEQLELAGLAQNCGYFDQAHFIHDFQAFSGLTPTSYQSHQTQHHNHVARLTK